MKQKIKQLQSSGETRKTNRTWHFLSTLNSLLLSNLLLLLIIPVIGSTAAWAATESISWAITTNSLTITPTITPSEGAKLSNASGTISLNGFSSTSSQKNGYCKPFYKTAVEFDATKNFAEISFVVADGYTFTPTSLGMTVFSYNTGNLKYKVVISDSKTIATSVTSNEIQPSSNGEAAITFADGAFTGKTFEGTVTIKLYAYNLSNSGSGTRTYIKSPITISGTTAAKAPEESYTVTYTAGEGGTSAKSSDTYTGSALTLPTVTPKTEENNYQKVFNGWYTASSGGTRVGGAGDSYTPGDDIELFAQYNTKYYISTTVAPEGGGAEATIVASGTPISNGSYVMEGTEITVTAGAANSGYAWNRWSVGTNNASLSFDYTVAAKKTYTANYTTNTAITPSSAAYTVGDTPSSITYAPTLSPAGDGATYQWYKNSANSAVVDNEHKIDGATSATLAAAKIDTGSEGTTYYYCVVTPTYDTGSKSGTSATSNIVTVTVSAAVAATYSVTYNANLAGTTGSVPTDATAYAEGGTVIVKGNTGTLAKSGYTFLGWSTTSGYSSTYKVADETITMGTANVTLYAQWKLNSSLVSSSPASGTLATGAPVYTTATSPATGMYAEQAATAFDFTTLKAQTLKELEVGWTNNSSDAGGTQTLSVLLTDGTFYSDVITFPYTVGVATPVISCSSNTVTITCATDGAEIYYTTDGNAPSSSSTAYSASGPFSIDADCTVKAIAIKNATNSAEASLACTHEDISTSTTLPVTYNFTDGEKWPEDGNIGTSGKLVELKNRADEANHSFYIRKSADNKFTLTNGTKLSMNDNGSTSNFIAIPISGINGRIDIDVWSPYTSADEYTLRYVLDTSNGTTVQSTAPSDITKKKSANGWVTNHFNFRINNISATTTSGVLYIGRGESGFPDFYKIKISTPSAYLVPTPTSLTLGDAQTDTVVIKNYTPYNVRIKTYADETIAKSFYDPVSNKLAIDAVAPGSTNVVLFADINGNGTEDSEEEVTRINIPITINGITDITTPSSAVYDTSGGSASPALADISITATHRSGAEMSYQWYKNSVNSNTGGTAISGATSNILDKSKISTSATEDASFYYCVVSATGCKPKASDVAYVLTSKTKRYFQMSNVAGNKETATNNEEITGQVIAGGHAYVQTSENYRYITRPNTNVAHMYVANGSDKYFKITLGKAIATDDVISVLINGYLSSATGITVATDASGSNAITLSSLTDTSIKTYAATFTSAFSSKTEIYVKGIYGGLSNYFTDLIIGKPADLVVGAPTPASQTVQVGDTPETISVTASGGTGSYSYQWYSNTSNTATVDNAHKIADATSASYTPPTTAAVTTYYYCTVTSGGNTVTSTTAKVEVKDIEHGWHNPTFTDNVEVYALTNTNFSAQPSSPNHFWIKESSVSYKEITCTPVSETKASYMQLKNSSNQKSIIFYVKNAIAFDMVAGDGKNNTSKKANIKVGTTKVGTLVNDQKWTDKFSLNADGDTITIDGPDGDIYLGALRFYMYSPIEVSRAGTVMERDTIYVDDTSVAYDVTSSRPGALSVTKPDGATGTATDYYTSTARVQFDAEHGVLTVSPIALGTETITIAQAASGDYPAITRTFTVVVAKHTLNLEFALDEININASILISGSAIPAGSLPTLHAYKDGVEVTGAAKDALGIKYMSDDVTIGSFADEDNYTITYGGGQGGALIYAYVASSDVASNAKDYFGLNIKAGTSNALPSTAKAGEDKEIYEQKRFELQNDEGENVVTLVYGGYKYDKEGGWTNASSRGKYHIDGFKYYTRHDIDALDEYGYQLRGMSDESKAAPSSLELKKDMDHHDYSHTYHLSSWSSQNVGNHTFWYTTSEQKPDGSPYKEYERIRPFTLPCYGGYLKFETHKTGTLTVYVWQNGSINAGETTDSKKLGTKPRLSYWFDQDGWVKQPKVAPITKQPITNSKYGHDTFCNALKTEDALDDKWTEANGDKAIIPMLLRKYCNSEKTVFSNTKESGYIDNPYYWMTSGDIENNLNEERTIIPKKMTPVPYHNGYMVPEESYLKYVIDVVAGKTYYFYGMMTKIGYVGMNFIEDNGVKAAYKVTEVPTLHLNTNDNMETVVNSMGDDYDFAVYNEVTLPSNYRAGKWNTICLPFALSEDQVEEAFGKGTQLTLYNGLIKKGTDYTIKYLSHVDTNILPGQPYFIKPSGVDASDNALPTDANGILGSAVEGQTGTRITFNTVCIDKKQFSTTTCKYSNDSDVDGSGVATGADAGFELVGTYAKTAIDQYSYLINASTGKLRQYTGATTSAANGLNTYHAFLRPKNADVKHNSLSQIDFEEDAIIEYAWLENETPDIPTPVKTIEEEVVDALNSGRIVMPNKAYNLMGQEVDPRSAKGLVIINGKKVMY